MKKIILILPLLFCFNLTNANFDFSKCNNGTIDNCPSFVIGKVGEFQEIKELNGDIGKESNILFNLIENYILLTNKIESYNKNIFLSQYGYKNNPNFFIPKKGNVLLVDLGGISNIDEINKYFDTDKKNYYLNLLKNNKNSVLSDDYQGFIEVKCKNDKIYFGKNNNISFDETSKPDIFKNFNLEKMQKYLQDNIKTCKNFNEMFNLKQENKVEILKTKTEQIVEKNIDKESIQQKSWFEKIIDFLKGIFGKIFG